MDKLFITLTCYIGACVLVCMFSPPSNYNPIFNDINPGDLAETAALALHFTFTFTFSRRFCPKRRTRERIVKLRAIEPGVPINKCYVCLSLIYTTHGSVQKGLRPGKHEKNAPSWLQTKGRNQTEMAPILKHLGIKG